MAKRYNLTARRRAALRKAQLASARKRRRNRKIKRAAVVGGTVAGVTGLAVARHKLSGSKIQFNRQDIMRIPGERTAIHHVNGKPIRSVVQAPNNHRMLGKPGFHAAKTAKGFQVGYRSRARKPVSPLSNSVRPDRVVMYHHDRIKTRELASHAATVMGSKVTNRRVVAIGRYVSYSTRGIRGKRNPFAPLYNQSSPYSYGAYGKRIPRLDKYIKTRGGKPIQTA